MSESHSTRRSRAGKPATAKLERLRKQVAKLDAALRAEPADSPAHQLHEQLQRQLDAIERTIEASEQAATTPVTTPTKPPRPAGPLYRHATGQWSKKIRGKLYYFGADHATALARYQAEAADLHAGRTPRASAANGETLSLESLGGLWLNTKHCKLIAGELSERTYADYVSIVELVCAGMGGKRRLVADIGPDDFQKLKSKLCEKWGPVRVGNVINMVRQLFGFAIKNGLITRPVIFGEGFARPSQKVLRKHRAEKGPNMLEAVEIRAMLEKAKQPLKSMIYLGLNCGYGNNDIGMLPVTALDLDRGWATFARPKTGINRKCPLWTETIASLREWLEQRPEPTNEAHGGRVFTTKYGNAWDKLDDRTLSKETRKLLNALKIKAKGFYSLRHTLQTIGDESRDFVAVQAIMGHADNTMSGAYRERISDERLRAVTDHVGAWLFADDDQGDDDTSIIDITSIKRRQA